MSSTDTLIQVTKALVNPLPNDGEGITAKDRNYKLHRRFDRLGRLYGDAAVNLLLNTKVCGRSISALCNWVFKPNRF
jgi:hypothetical protein